MAHIDRSLSGTYEYVCINDDAYDSGTVDPETGMEDDRRREFRQEWVEAMLTGDMSKLAVKEGRKPMVWTLRYIGSRHGRRIQEEIQRHNRGVPQEEQQIGYLAHYMAARLGLVSVKGLWDTDQRGNKVEFAVSRDVDPLLDTMAVTHDCMDALGNIRSADGSVIGEALITELGLMVINGGAPSGKS